MPDLNVVAVLKAKPGSEDVVGAALTDLAKATAGEEGCISYDLTKSVTEPHTFITIERWRSQDDLDAHMQTPHIAEAMRIAGDHLSEAPAIHPLQPVS